MPDHVHMFLSALPKVAPALIAKVLKGSTARELFVEHPRTHYSVDFGVDKLTLTGGLRQDRWNL